MDAIQSKGQVRRSTLNDHTLQSSRPILDDLVGLSIGDHRRCPCCVGSGSIIIGLNIQTAYLPVAEGPLIVVAKGCTNLKLSGSIVK